ncbi:type IV pilin protein [Thioalkalivibrio sulfidiphilus]|uniref:type IV pilin protein n=1 Tax=Thioalkalivibrio sulfidiphilus TaxID=1033854 RepID=UPI000375346F|nr:type IV pilin protein [Thioalkalivibrio sulfidiphilus]
MHSRKNSLGFTLIEVMIVVVVIGIIAAIAYPNYTRYVQNTRMANAQGDLMELAQWMERQFTLNNSYAGLTLPFSVSPKDSGTVAYNISFVAAPTANAYTLQAVPTGPQAGHECGTLTLNQAGVRGANLTTCWR